MQVKCIFCLKENDINTQENREHIFPKTYGGQRRLEKGIVCDACNSKFSKFELDFARESLLTLPKQFLHPKSKKAKKGKITQKIQIIETDKNDFLLGYIQEGESLFCPQIVVRNSMSHSFIYFTDFIKNLDLIIKTKIDKIKFTKHIKIKEGEPIIGIANGKILAYYNSEEDKESLKKFKSVLSQKRQEIIDQYDPGKLSKVQHKVVVHQEFSFNFDSMNRTICKIALNTIAHYFGDLIYERCFDDLREYVKTGTIDYTPVHLLENKRNEPLYEYILKDISNNHLVLAGNLHQAFPNQIALISFYDSSFVFVVSLKNDTFKVTIGDLPFRLLVINYKRSDKYGDYELFDEVISQNRKREKELYSNLDLINY